VDWQQSFENLLVNPSVQVDAPGFAINLCLAALLAWGLAAVYVRFGGALSNRRRFGRTFVMIATTTVLVISIVKSSLALSLGLVGALSVVRFRAAIKEPAELAYLLLSVAIGIGLGTDQRALTLVGFGAVVALIGLRHRGAARPRGQNLRLACEAPSAPIPVAGLVETLERHCRSVDVRRVDEAASGLDASFLVEFDELAQLESAVAELLARNRELRISFLDAKGVTP
jgi:hypothetical protein